MLQDPFYQLYGGNDAGCAGQMNYPLRRGSLTRTLVRAFRREFPSVFVVVTEGTNIVQVIAPIFLDLDPSL